MTDGRGLSFELPPVAPTSQDTTGIPGSTEKEDKLGTAVSLTDLSGRGSRDHLLLGTEGEDTGNGTLLYLPASSSGPPCPGRRTTASLGRVRRRGRARARY
ncbi:hypothetical protein [Streptomyces ureilyticus]|uniref:Uncharacterized protein n=1 Tax=Streptomyces ureilyticus TaxID=1775131 RepID=A0ABX0DYG2_9ACTN|nr:hypothetical protein [Streptomyces ureilyticus]NGO46956.1 hypothetical protein [Streptomyces ureilyticus]